MRAITCVLVLTVLVSTFAAPSSPTWPSAFSATVWLDTHGQGHDTIFRWFYDEDLQQERKDMPVEWEYDTYIASIIADYPSGTEYKVYYQGDTVACITQEITTTIPVPQFSAYSYVGTSLVSYQQCYHWAARVNGTLYQLYDRVSDREIVKYEVIENNGNEETWSFWEFDEGSQDPSLFVLDDPVYDICYTPSN